MAIDLTGADLGPPGVVFAAAAPVPPRLGAEPMDVAAFAGVAPRGPAWERTGDQDRPWARTVAVPVDDWDSYLQRFGGFDGPGLLPHAVAAFFAQGGRRAYVLRIVADGERPGDDRPPPGCARLDLMSAAAAPGTPAPLRLRARDEGSWGNRLTARLVFTARPLTTESLGPGLLRLDDGSAVPRGVLVRVHGPDGASIAVISDLRRVGRSTGAGDDLVAALDRPVEAGPAPLVEVVDAELTVIDTDPVRPRREVFTGLGLHPAHPAYLVDVVRAGSQLVDVLEPPWVPGPDLSTLDGRGRGGADRWQLITPGDFFGGLPHGDDTGVHGLDCLTGTPEPATVVVPDLYAPGPPPAAPGPPPRVPGDPGFVACTRPTAAAEPTVPPGPGLIGLLLDPAEPDHLDRIVRLQGDLALLAGKLGLVALLDVPPGLLPRQVLRWRSRLESSSAASYHPWLRVTGPDPAGPLVALPPSAVAAGILARCELRDGVGRGAANEPAAGVVDVAEVIDPARHAELHRLGINVFRPEPGAIMLTTARTLAADPAWRQLSVRRLLLLVQRAVRRQLQWAVFEPDDAALRAGLARSLDQLLGVLFEQGALAGATPAESWFVTIAAGGPPGTVIVQVGVAAAEPAEFIVVRVTADAAGAIESGLSVGGPVMGRV
jgi:hypothetical protein